MRVLVADDHPLYREALADTVRQRPDLELVAKVASGREALAEIRDTPPDVAVLEVKMPDLEYALWKQHKIRIRSTGERICDAIAAVSRGETVLDPEVQAGVAHEIRLRVEDERPALTSREREILRLTADGCSAPQIAEQLYLSPTTVRTHLQHLYDKLGVSDRAAAVAEAMRQRLLE